MTAARCAGTFAGRLGPLAADFIFLSSGCQNQRHVNENDFDNDSMISDPDIQDEPWLIRYFGLLDKHGSIKSPLYILEDQLL